MRKLFSAVIFTLVLASIASAVTTEFTREVAKKDVKTSQQWAVDFYPAKTRSDNTIRLLADNTQPIYIRFAVSDEVFKSPKHDIELDLELPSSVKFLDCSGGISKSEITSKTENSVTTYHIALTITNNAIGGKIGQRSKSEWKSIRLYVQVPKQLSDNEKPVAKITVTCGSESSSSTSKLAIEPLTKPGVQTKTRIGLWCYGFGMAGEKSSAGLAKMLQTVGIRHMQKASPSLYAELKKHNIVHGAACHRSGFYEPQFDDLDVHGNHSDGTKADGTKGGPRSLWPCEAVLAESGIDPTTLRGVKYMVKRAKENDGIATLDYEPHATLGFAPKSLEIFKKETNSTDADIEKLRQALIKYGREIYITEDKEAFAIYKKWVDWRNTKYAAFIKILDEGFHKLYPEGRFELTPTASYLDDDDTYAHGVKSIVMAPYLDVIQPQIYRGYGAKAAKSTMVAVRGWREGMDKMKARAELHPIVLASYCCARVNNSPQRLHQQMIGTIAEGADGVIIYYADQLDAPYWIQIAETTRCLDRYEDFYRDGKRVTENFEPIGLPKGFAQLQRWPAHKLRVENPEWNITAHELGDKVLLTMFNLSECDDLYFRFNDLEGYTFDKDSSYNANVYGEGWLISPKQIGFVVLKKDKK